MVIVLIEIQVVREKGWVIRAGKGQALKDLTALIYPQMELAPVGGMEVVPQEGTIDSSKILARST